MLCDGEVGPGLNKISLYQCQIYPRDLWEVCIGNLELPSTSREIPALYDSGLVNPSAGSGSGRDGGLEEEEKVYSRPPAGCGHG